MCGMVEFVPQARYMPLNIFTISRKPHMTTVVLVIHLMIALTLIGVVLLQRSEGGALGIGGGGGGAGGSMFSSRGAANFLTRATAGLAVCFFITSIVLTLLARGASQPTSVFEGVQSEQTESGSGETTGGGSVLPTLPGSTEPSAPQAPTE